MSGVPPSTEARARMSQGASDPAVHELVLGWLREQPVPGGTIVDVGCGQGNLFQTTRRLFERYVGVDVVRHPGLPPDADFACFDLNAGAIPLPSAEADVVACVETIEHVENPRALIRELTRLLRPGGWIALTTPNQLSLASKLCLAFKNEFLHFQERPGLYPAHITALLEIDLRRMLREVGLHEIGVRYSGRGRIPLTDWHWPARLSQRAGWGGRALSDNLLVYGRK